MSLTMLTLFDLLLTAMGHRSETTLLILSRVPAVIGSEREICFGVFRNECFGGQLGKWDSQSVSAVLRKGLQAYRQRQPEMDTPP